MSLLIASLNSGSNGNCYYVGNDREAVFIDAGLSCRETEKRMKRLELSMAKVKAIFISHEHTDHIKGLPVIISRYQVPVFISRGTFENSGLSIAPSLLNFFSGEEPVTIGSLSVTGFSKQHDAADPHSFTVEGNDVRVGVLTDIGSPCSNVRKHFAACHAAFLEANYDDDMLQGGKYPYYLKKRISSDKGHLSNQQALDLFTGHRPAFMSHLLLSHLSKDNNSPDRVSELFCRHAGSTKIIVASRFRETPLYRIHGENSAPGVGQDAIGADGQTSLF